MNHVMRLTAARQYRSSVVLAVIARWTVLVAVGLIILVSLFKAQIPKAVTGPLGLIALGLIAVAFLAFVVGLPLTVTIRCPACTKRLLVRWSRDDAVPLSIEHRGPFYLVRELFLSRNALREAGCVHCRRVFDASV